LGAVGGAVTTSLHRREVRVTMAGRYAMQTFLRRWRLRALFTPKYLVASVLLLLGVVGALGLSAAVKEKNSLTRLLIEQGTALAETLEVSSRNALVANRLLERSIAQRLLDNARLIDRILQGQTVYPQKLAELARSNQLDRIELLDAQGNLLAAFPPLMGMPGPPGGPMMGPGMMRGGWGMMRHKGMMRGQMWGMMQHHFYQPILEGKATEALQGFGARKFWLGKKYGVAVKRQYAPGVIVITAAADTILRFRQQIGLQRLLTDLKSPHIAYISIQDADATFIAHSDERLVGTPAPPPAVAAGTDGRDSRIRTTADGRRVLEITRSFAFEGKPLGLLRVGLSMQHVQQVWRQALVALLLTSSAILVVGTLGVGVILTNQAAHFRKVQELEKAVARQERLAALGHLAAEVAHEVRNPLNAISMGLQRLQREFPPREAAARQEFDDISAVIRNEVKRLNQTIEDFLKLARPIKVQLQVCDINGLLREFETLMQEEAQSRGIQWQVSGASQLPSLLADRGQLRQALLNLVLNALQATPPGGRVSLEADTAGQQLRLRLRDTGSGIAPQALERIFDPYYTTKAGGTGLGLPIAQQIVQAHGGRIEVSSVVGQGSTFTVWLPLAQDQDV
jgi:signal transduction histidine kinase